MLRGLLLLLPLGGAIFGFFIRKKEPGDVDNGEEAASDKDHKATSGFWTELGTAATAAVATAGGVVGAVFTRKKDPGDVDKGEEAASDKDLKAASGSEAGLGTSAYAAATTAGGVVGFFTRKKYPRDVDKVVHYQFDSEY